MEFLDWVKHIAAKFSSHHSTEFYEHSVQQVQRSGKGITLGEYGADWSVYSRQHEARPSGHKKAKDECNKWKQQDEQPAAPVDTGGGGRGKGGKGRGGRGEAREGNGAGLGDGTGPGCGGVTMSPGRATGSRSTRTITTGHQVVRPNPHRSGAVIKIVRRWAKGKHLFTAPDLWGFGWTAGTHQMAGGSCAGGPEPVALPRAS
ncbi:hypothetical protein CYMTET_25872 [Cymbomonas tetramitiformis]|uniref:Uncharacterized protein n=1 Tax=Cymbomonas tetramitiformis TaxID=36881 RepID=A0AAE0KP21_9CHLO|nr:hypothetical protein CYMTET_35562 [Cymbomonas tetramitiformis]KAK3265444.1 hypothetical protein CYMTET_25872 [Cymbomonas tetramitiformis]